MDALLPPVKREIQHFNAMPYRELPAFMVKLRAREGIVERGLEFLILTAARRTEAFGATWDEIDFGTRTWTVPAVRMKRKTDAHEVPLSDAAVRLLEQMPRTDARIFPVSTTMAAWYLLRKIELRDLTVHGFRSSFRDWAGNETMIQREICEAALSHIIGDKAEQAYRREDGFDKRVLLMQMWADYCGTRPANVTALPTVRRA
jgi:integrase